MSTNQLSAAGLQKLIHKVLSLDVEAPEKLKPFDGKTVLIDITDLKFQYYFVFTDGQVLVHPEMPSTNEGTPMDPSVTISGKLISFLTTAAAEHSSDALFERDLHFSGEVNTAKRFQQLANSLNIDWQEPLAKLVGDPIAHTINTSVKRFSHWFLQVASSARQDFSEYIQEEARITPSESEQQHFFEQVDQLRSQSDRLVARVERLKEQLQPVEPLKNSQFTQGYD